MKQYTVYNPFIGHHVTVAAETPAEAVCKWLTIHNIYINEGNIESLSGFSTSANACVEDGENEPRYFHFKSKKRR